MNVARFVRAAACAAVALAVGQALGVTAPASIRVGYNCSGTSCSTVEVMSMATYVRRGLNDEWIASWNANSLRSGAVSYRSYGAYYVAHPIRSNYDICSTTSCQVNDSDTSTATTDADIATAGLVLTRDGTTAFRSEYSAQNNAWNDPNDGLSCVNNDLSCGNGFVGSPASNWPCLSDSVGANKGCFGHGRGSSQWGTQYWAANHAKDWKWITNHYYNANGRPSGLRSAFLSKVTGTVTTSGGNLNVRSGPGTAYSIVGSFANGATVTIHCQVRGQTITGTFGTSDLWDRIGSGQYVPDVYLHTGSDGRVAPNC